MTGGLWRVDPDGSSAALARTMRDENFPVAPRVLPRLLREQLTSIYRYARYVDDLGDEGPGDRVPRLQDVAQDVHRLYAGRVPHDPVVAALRPVVEATQIPADSLLRLVQANVADQHVTSYRTFGSLLGYCHLSADPVGEIVLHLLGRASVDRVALSDRICTGLQLLEHWKDVREDYRRGRVYLPRQDLRRFDVDVTELGRSSASPHLRALLAFETTRALAWLDSGAPLVSTLHGWGRVAVAGYVAGGRAAARELRRCGYDPLSHDPTPTSVQVARAYAMALIRRPG